MIIYHNPRCQKSRETLALIRAKGEEPEIVEYLNFPLSAKEILELSSKLRMPVEALLRKKESEFIPYKGRSLSDGQWADVLADHPKLLERPIVVRGKQAIIGRPPENVNELF